MKQTDFWKYQNVVNLFFLLGNQITITFYEKWKKSA